jgi:hypothetical protein
MFCSCFPFSHLPVINKFIVVCDGTEYLRIWLRPAGARAHRGLMTNDLKLQKDQLDQIRRERAQLAEQIRISQQTIERSQQLIRQMDEILAKAEQNS